MIYREDGFLEIQLEESLVFDDYLFSLIQEDPYCLSCIRDHRKSHHYYYDLHGLQTLKEYLSCHPMLDLLSFSIRLFTMLWKVSCRKRIIFDCDYLFISAHGSHLRILCLPVAIPVQEDDLSTFIKELCELFYDVKDYETLGFIYASALQKDSLKNILDFLLVMEKKRYMSLPFWKRWKKKTQFEDVIEPLPKSNPLILPNDLQNNETQILCMNEISYFEEMESKESIYIRDDMVKIGRANDNQWVISSMNVSSYHACFVASQHKLMDLGSLNGTYVNDVRIEECILQDQDRVRFAMQTYIYHEK